MDSPRERVLFGAAYYHEYQPSPRLDTDLDLMTKAGFSVIRVGESVWTTWEPEEGRFDLDWLAPVLDGAHQRGIAVVLGTPTYAAPPWLARRYPEIAGETSTGQPMPWGGRQEIDYTHPAFKFYAETGHPQDRLPILRATLPSSDTRSTTSPACCSSTTTASSNASSTSYVIPMARWKRSTKLGGWSTGLTSSARGPTCGRRTATGSPSTISPGAFSKPS